MSDSPTPVNPFYRSTGIETNLSSMLHRDSPTSVEEAPLLFLPGSPVIPVKQDYFELSEKYLMNLMEKQKEALRAKRRGGGNVGSADAPLGVSEVNGGTKRTFSIMFLTINPKDDVSLKSLMGRFNQMLRWKHVKECTYVFEQRSVEIQDAGRGMHIHALIKHTGSLKDLKDKIIRLFLTQSKMIGNRKHIDVQTIKSREQALYKYFPDEDLTLEQMFEKYYIDYMTDNIYKDDYDTKEADFFWREKNNLESIYYFAN